LEIIEAKLKRWHKLYLLDCKNREQQKTRRTQ
jgi:hypothetical protein